jgi:hypothetical protein
MRKEKTESEEVFQILEYLKTQDDTFFAIENSLFDKRRKWSAPEGTDTQTGLRTASLSA